MISRDSSAIYETGCEGLGGEEWCTVNLSWDVLIIGFVVGLLWLLVS